MNHTSALIYYLESFYFVVKRGQTWMNPRGLHELRKQNWGSREAKEAGVSKDE